MGKNEIEIETKPKIDEIKYIEITIDGKDRTNVTQAIEGNKFEPNTISTFEITRQGNDNSSNTNTLHLDVASKQNKNFYDRIKTINENYI